MTEEELKEAAEMLNEMVENCGGDRPDNVHINVKALFNAMQEIGWENDTMFDVHKPKYAFNKNMCHETTYANNYVTMLHRSPFASQKMEEKKP